MFIMFKTFNFLLICLFYISLGGLYPKVTPSKDIYFGDLNIIRVPKMQKYHKH